MKRTAQGPQPLPSAEGGRVSTALYRHFDHAGKLLYVGISLSATYRLAQHRERSAWAKDIARVEVEQFETRVAALEAERVAIQRECPAFNIAHNPTNKAQLSKIKSPKPRCDQGRVGCACLVKGKRGWAILDETTGRWDGWYSSETLAAEMLAFHKSEWPTHRFILVAGVAGDLPDELRKIPLNVSEVRA